MNESAATAAEDAYVQYSCKRIASNFLWARPPVVDSPPARLLHWYDFEQSMIACWTFSTYDHTKEDP